MIGELPKGISFQTYMREHLRLLREAAQANLYAAALLQETDTRAAWESVRPKPDLWVVAQQVQGFLGRADAIEELANQTR